MVWYIVTIALGILLDLGKIRNSKKWKTYRKLYVIWLYVFLCFGYMNGSDWRDYEPQYETIQSDIKFVERDYGFYYLWYLISFITKDYWIMVALLKSLYLTTVIKLTKEITPYWLATLGFLMPISLIFMTIQNPLRFMVALTIVNVAFFKFLKKKYLLFAILSVSAVVFHATTAFFIVAIPLLKFSERVSKINKIYILLVYIGVLYFSSNATIINNIFSSSMVMVASMYEGMKDYSHYFPEDNTAFFTLGSILNMMLFGVVLFMRDDVINNFGNGRFVYGSVIIYSFLQRFCMMVPTGFRLVIPLGIFYAAYIVYCLKFGRKIALIFVLYYSFAYPKKLWNSYDLIPYTNSIYYIVAGHKPYSVRSEYNYKAYYERHGHSHEDNRGETINFKNK